MPKQVNEADSRGCIHHNVRRHPICPGSPLIVRLAHPQYKVLLKVEIDKVGAMLKADWNRLTSLRIKASRPAACNHIVLVTIVSA